MNGNQITISVTNDDFNQLRTIARTRGQTVSDYISCLVSSNLIKSGTAGTTTANAPKASMAATEAATPTAMESQQPVVLKTARARAR